MRFYIIVTAIATLLFCTSLAAKDYKGFFNYSYQEGTGKTLLTIDHLNREFIMVNYVGSGVGSNDIGLDRGKIMDTKVVKFQRFGDKIFLIQSNYGYRAISNNPAERKAVEDAFSSSVLFAFKPESELGNSIVIDITPFLTEDINNIIGVLRDTKQGLYKLDKSRSAVHPNYLLAFPQNVEFESINTYVGEPSGQFIKDVAATPEVISIRQHISFVQLPDDHYKPRKYNVNSGFFDQNFFDYASNFNEPIGKKYLVRHRLEKKNPLAEKSEAIKPLIYYVDNGCPEPIKSALIEGASWWKEAFEEAGFVNAFQVKELPADAHPLDVRYNVIQWVHRNTRGWSYGSTVTDPRTGEIIKGHVSLGSLRVRQDYLIAQGALSPFTDSTSDDSALTEMALARLRQLSAHEVGHTIGLAHNFAASMNKDASVMDYPHPKFELIDGKVSTRNVYSTGIGEWDKRAVVYGYSQFNENEETGLRNIMSTTLAKGLLFISDPDARPDESASQTGHLWDNDSNTIGELKRILELRKFAISKFGKNTIKSGVPFSELDNAFVPLYYMHRYQAEAVSKLVGGINYSYDMKDQGEFKGVIATPKDVQLDAINALMLTISQENLTLDTSLEKLFLPQAYGYARTRESLPSRKIYGLDQNAISDGAINHVVRLLFIPSRLERVNQQRQISIEVYFDLISLPMNDVYRARVEFTKLKYMINLMKSEAISDVVKASIIKYIFEKEKEIEKSTEANDLFILDMINTYRKGNFQFFDVNTVKTLPPGAPIGCDEDFEFVKY